MDNQKNRRSHMRTKWMPCLTSAIILVVIFSVVVTTLLYTNTFRRHSMRPTSGQSCHARHQTGHCLAKGYCCVGQYAIGRDVCSGDSLCCLGTVTKCKDSKPYDYWSFSSLMDISSKIIYRNVSEPIVEQAIVFSVTAIEEKEFYDQMSEKIGEDMTATTGHKWIAVVGNKDSFDTNLVNFSGYIIITINEVEVVLLRMPDMSALLSDMLEDARIAFDPASNQNHPAHSNGHQFREPEYVINARPTIEIIRSELNGSTQESVLQTIDYVLSTCLNNYGCVSHKLVEALNQQMPSSGSVWHSIVGTDAPDHQLVVDIDYLNGFLLDVIFHNRHRVLVYKTGIQMKIPELEVITSGRRALALNKTVIYDNYPFVSKEFKRDSERRLLLEAINRAVMTSDKYVSVCQKLTSEANKGVINWGCVAGPHHGFDYSIGRQLSKHFISIKLNDLFIMLFRDRFSKILP